MRDEEVVFRTPIRPYTRREILLAARFRGELDPVRAVVHAGLACTRYAEEEGFEVAGDRLQEAADALRYALDLETEEATERWFARRQVTLDEFTALLTRRLLHQRFQDRSAELASAYAPTPEDTERALRLELLFSGAEATLALALARRVAVRSGFAQRGTTPAPAACARAGDAFLLQRGWADASTRDAARARLGLSPEACAELLELEALFAVRCAELLTRERLEKELAARRAELVRIDVEGARFASLAAAREALLCLREDGDALAVVGRRAGATASRATGFLDDFPPTLAPALLSARPGEALGPVSADAGEHWIYRVVGKSEPTLEDPELCRRLHARILDPIFAQEVDQHVRWSPGEAPAA